MTEPTPTVADEPTITAAQAADAAGEAAELDLDMVRRYTALRNAEKGADAEAKALKAEADALQAELVDQFSEAGMQSLNLDGHTIYLHRSTFAQRAEGIDAEDVKKALRAAGADELISETVNAQTLSAYVREFLDGDDAPGLPEPLKDVLDLGERYGIRIRAAAKPRAKRS